MDIQRSRPETATRCASVPTDDGRGSYTLEVITGNRVVLRVAKMSVFFSRNEARRVLVALAGLLGVEITPVVRQ